MINQAEAWSIRELTRRIKNTIEADAALQNIWVRAEISNFKHHTSGHMYFTLKDETSRIRAVMFASRSMRLRFIPEEGMRVLARGSVSVYERDGQYQFYVEEMQPDGIGNLYLAFEELKRKLESEGLFAAERKRKLPFFPRAIGVLTSPTGAAVRDILTTLRRRQPSVKVIVFPVVVQGRDAVPSIVRAIQIMNERNEVDVMIVGRGGGSLEELWAFNEEAVARAIAASRIPIISAVGHETDFTIADFVADLRAATPTAAAELAVPHRLELKQQLFSMERRLKQALFYRLEQNRIRLERLRRSPVLMNPKRQLQEPLERLDRLHARLRFAMKTRIAHGKERHRSLQRALVSHHPGREIEQAIQRRKVAVTRLRQAVYGVLQSKRMLWQARLRHLDALSPLKVMERGYSVTYDEHKQKIIKSVTQVQLGDLIKVMLRDGELDCQVWSMKGEVERDEG